MKLTNRWNTLVYRLWSPIYDTFGDRIFRRGRERAMQLLAPRAGERLLVPGVGTGADLPLVPEGVEVTGVDLSPHMLAKAREKIGQCRAKIELVEGDAQAIPVPEASYDAALLNLILSVVPDGRACFHATLRALKPGGRVVVFDKFQPDGERLSLTRRALNLASTAFGTEITRRFGELTAGEPCSIEVNEPSLLRGAFRLILLRKTT